VKSIGEGLHSAFHELAMTRSSLPRWIVLTYTTFMLVLIPVYAWHYGWTNFLYFCDVALLLTLYGMWRPSPLAISMAAVGILLPQALWCADYAWGGWHHLMGQPYSGMTGYMFDEAKPFYLRALSLFHGWLPFLLVYLVMKVGYDSRALVRWTLLMVGLCLFAYFALPPAGAVLVDPNTPRNVNYVFGMNDSAPQTWLPSGGYLVGWMGFLFACVALPTHLVLKKWVGHSTS
jgi:hypothetical protein